MTTHSIIQQAVAALKQGKIIAYPTEAIFGLGCDPFNPAAVKQLLSLKQRPVSKGLILIAHNWEQIEALTLPIEEKHLMLAQKTWPGPRTWIFPASSNAPAWIRGEHTGIALRVTQHPIASALCQAFGGPIVSTSANLDGEIPAKDIATIHRYFPSGLEMVVDEALGDASSPTTIQDILTGKTIRPG